MFPKRRRPPFRPRGPSPAPPGADAACAGARGTSRRARAPRARRTRRRSPPRPPPRHHRIHEVASSVGVGHRRDVDATSAPALGSDAARSTSPSSRSATAAAAAGRTAPACPRARRRARAARAREARGGRRAPARAPGGAVGVARIAPRASPTESRTTAASSWRRSSPSWPAYAAATVARSAETGFGPDAPPDAPTRRPRPTPRGSRGSRGSSERASSRSRRVLRTPALPRGGDGERVREQPFLRRQRARLSRVAAFQQVLDRAAPAPKPQVDVRVPQRLRHRLQPLELGDVLAGSIPGARAPTRYAALRSYVPIAASNRGLPPSSASRWSSATSESTSSRSSRRWPRRSIAEASRVFFSKPETAISASRRRRTRRSAPSRSGGHDRACAESITSSHRSGRSASVSTASTRLRDSS